MVKTPIRVLILGSLIAGEIQAQSVEPDIGNWAAALAEHVDGDYGAALSELESRLPGAVGLERAELLVRLGVLDRMLGRTDRSREHLRELADMHSPYEEWARDQLAKSIPRETRRISPQDPQIPEELWGIVQRIGKHQEATDELRNLGSLAIPAIVKALDEEVLDAAGARAALDLLSSYEDPRVAGVVRRMLESQDPIRQVVAAECIPRLKGSARHELGRLALEAEAAMVRLRGIEALSDAEDMGEVLRPAVERLVEDRSTNVRESLAWLLDDKLQSGTLPVDRWLEQLARDSEESVYQSAIRRWLQRRRADESQRRIQLFESLPRWHADYLLAQVLRDSRFTDEALLVRAVEFPDRYDEIISRISDRALAGAPEFLRAALAAEVETERLLGVIRDKRVEALLDEAASLLTHPTSYIRAGAFRAVAALQPELLLARAEELVADPKLSGLTARLLADYGGPGQVPAMVEALRLGLTGSPTPAAAVSGTPLLRALVLRSDASSLEAVLDLVSIPDVQVDTGTWSARADAVQRALPRWFERASIAPALRRIRTVDSGVARTVLLLTLEHVEPRDVGVITELLEGTRREGLQDSRSTGDRRMLVPLSSLDVARSCVRILGAAGGERARSALRDLIRDPRLGSTALRALLAMEGPAELELFAEILADQELRPLVRYVLGEPEVAEDEDLRAAAERCLLTWESAEYPRPRQWLTRLSQGERRRVCTAMVDRLRGGPVQGERLLETALELLGRERDGGLVETLALGMRSHYSSVRIAAVTAFMQTFSKDAAPHLIEALKDEDEEVVLAAQAALSRLSEYFAEKEKWEKVFGIKKDG